MGHSVSCPRTPSDQLRQLLMPGGFLAPLLALHRREFNGTELDVHFRIKDGMEVYCGLTKIITAKRLNIPKGYIKIDADNKYKGQPCAKQAGIFRRWADGEHGFTEAIESYLGDVEVNQSFIKGEGGVQSRWSKVTAPWIPFDREAVLNYESTEHRVESKNFPKVDSAFDAIRREAEHPRAQGGSWQELKLGARKVDQLAIDPEGRLVLLELKNARAKDSRVYYVPFQLLQYVWEWHSAVDAVRSELQDLLDARSALARIHRWTA